jgi:hypothetical protein
MTASVLNDWFNWRTGAVMTNLYASALWVPLTALWLHRHFKCRDCWRPATVPVPGTVRKVCRKHALEQGHTH